MGRISMPQGQGSLKHNRRDFSNRDNRPQNIDETKTSDNVVLVDRDLKAVYHDTFGASKDRYNAKQKRDDRKIDDYYKHLSKSQNGEKLMYENVIQWGSKEDFENSPETAQKAKNALEEYLKGFSERNPNLVVVGAYIHMDEQSPHAHLDWVPVAHGYKTGMDTRNSLDRALKEMGFVPEKESRYNNATMMWQARERAIFTDICKSHGLEVEPPEKARGSFSIREYEKLKDQAIKNLSKDLISHEEIGQIEVKKPLMGKDKVIISESDFDRLKTAAAVSKNIDEKIVKPIRQKEKEADEIIYNAEAIISQAKKKKNKIEEFAASSMLKKIKEDYPQLFKGNLYVPKSKDKSPHHEHRIDNHSQPSGR